VDEHPIEMTEQAKATMESAKEQAKATMEREMEQGCNVLIVMMMVVVVPISELGPELQQPTSGRNLVVLLGESYYLEAQ
jgi:hypothetical protein